MEAEEELPGCLASGGCPLGFGWEGNDELEVEGGEEIDGTADVDGGEGGLFAELFVDEIAPGKGEGVDEACVHDEACKVGDFSGSDVGNEGDGDVDGGEDDGEGLFGHAEYSSRFVYDSVLSVGLGGVCVSVGRFVSLVFVCWAVLRVCLRRNMTIAKPNVSPIQMIQGFRSVSRDSCWSQVSPIPSASVSLWSALGLFGQLSWELRVPSRSKSWQASPMLSLF